MTQITATWARSIKVVSERGSYRHEVSPTCVAQEHAVFAVQRMASLTSDFGRSHMIPASSGKTLSDFHCNSVRHQAAAAVGSFRIVGILVVTRLQPTVLLFCPGSIEYEPYTLDSCSVSLGFVR